MDGESMLPERMWIMTLYALTTDPARTWEIATLTPQELRVESLFPRDPLPSGPVAGVIIDLDYLLLDHAGLVRLVERAGRWAARFPVAVLSFNLMHEQENALRSMGVIVSRSLDATVMNSLLGLPPASAATIRPAA
jgi:hypothetical protein